MKVLISGGAGFIGSNLTLALIKRGHEVTVLDNLSPQIHTKVSPLYETIKNKVRFICGDVRSKNDWSLALEEQDVLVHLAAETGTGQSMYEIERYVDVNIRGTAIMLDLLANTEHRLKRIIIASSRSIYGEGKYKCKEHGVIYPTGRASESLSRGDFKVKCPHCGETSECVATDEESKSHPSSIYGITKHNQEQMVLTTGKSLGISSIAFRYQNVYGPGQSLSNPYTGILSIFSTRIKNKNEIVIFEDGLESRDFVYIDDVVAATILGIENKEVIYDAFNVGSGELTNVITVAKSLINAYGTQVKIRIAGTYRIGDIRNNYACLEKITRVLGYKPSIYFSEGIQYFSEWVNKQTVQIDNYEKSIEEMKVKGLYL